MSKTNFQSNTQKPVFNNDQILLVNISLLCLCLRSFSLAQNSCVCACSSRVASEKLDLLS